MFRTSAIKAVVPAAKQRSDREIEPQPIPLTEDEKIKQQAILARMREEMRAKGLFSEKVPESKVSVEWHKNCVVCGKENPPGLARVCSGDCYQKQPLEV